MCVCIFIRIHIHIYTNMSIYIYICRRWRCWRSCLCSDVCSRMLTYAHVCWRMQAVALLPQLFVFHSASRIVDNMTSLWIGMLTYAHVCSRMLNICPHTTTCVRILLHVSRYCYILSSYYYICVLIILYMRFHSTRCPRTTMWHTHTHTHTHTHHIYKKISLAFPLASPRVYLLVFLFSSAPFCSLFFISCHTIFSFSA